MPDPIRIDVWSDIACPWCYIGKRRLELAVAGFAENAGAAPVEVVFRSYELMPDLPSDFDGSTVDLLVTQKGLAAEQVRAMHDQVAGIAAEVGLHYDFASQQPTNTRKAHQVLALARARGVHGELTERLFRAHFVAGEHVGRDDDLADLAAESGLAREEVPQALAEQTYLPAVQADIDRARELGISGVPFFVLDGRYGLPGAQPPETFRAALAQVQADRRDGAAA